MSSNRRAKRLSAHEVLAILLEESDDPVGSDSDDSDFEPANNPDEIIPAPNDSEVEDNLEIDTADRNDEITTADVDELSDELSEDIYHENSDTDMNWDSDSSADHGDVDIGVTYTSKSGYAWKSKPLARRRAPSHNVVKEKLGLKSDGKIDTMIEAFNLFITQDIKQVIVQFTNQKANEFYEKWNRDKGDNKQWKEMDVVELDAFLGLLIMAGVLLSAKEHIRELWKMEDCGRPIFRATMGIERFTAITRFLRFDDLHTRTDRRASDKLAAFRDVLKLFQETLQKPYTPGPYLTIDEQLVPFRGRCPFRQYIPSKPAKYGIKWWLCCDSKNAYVCSVDVYVGKQEGDVPAKNIGEKVVLLLTDGYKGSGRNITIDNFFTTIPLAKTLLHDYNCTVLGTLRKNKREIPEIFLPSRERPITSSIFGFDNDLTLVSYVPKKNKAVVLLSTMHHEESVDGGEKKKPQMILDYNSTKGGVDTADQLTRTYSVKRKVQRWPVVCCYNMIDIAALNAMIIWLLNNPDWEAKRKYRRRLFLKQLARALVTPVVTERASKPQRGNVRRAIVAAGFPITAPKRVISTTLKRRCYLCGKKNDRKTVHRCVTCLKPICMSHASITEYTCEQCKSEMDIVE